MQRFKRILTWALLVLAAAAVVMTFQPRETVIIPDGISLLFWHAEKRCNNCRNIEKLVEQTLQDRKDQGCEEIRLIRLEYDVLAHQPLARQFRVGSITIILTEREHGQNIRLRDLTEEIRKTLSNEDAFKEMLRKELDSFCKKEHTENR